MLAGGVIDLGRGLMNRDRSHSPTDVRFAPSERRRGGRAGSPRRGPQRTFARRSVDYHIADAIGRNGTLVSHAADVGTVDRKDASERQLKRCLHAALTSGE
jgi:hypothetical protein